MAIFDGDRERMQELRGQNWTLQRIADEIGCSPSTVRDHLNDMGRNTTYHPDPRHVLGIVYVLGIYDFPDIYKIGRTTTNDAENRLRSCQTGNPWLLYIVAEYEYEDSIGLELSLHKKFSKWRMEGEWFDLSNDRKRNSRPGGSLQRIRNAALNYQRKIDKVLWR